MIYGYPRLSTAASPLHSDQNHQMVSPHPNSESQGGRARRPTQCAAQALCSLAIPSILLSWSFGNRRKREWRAYSPVLRARSAPRLFEYQRDDCMTKAPFPLAPSTQCFLFSLQRSIDRVNEYNDLLCRVDEIEKFGKHYTDSITAYQVSFRPESCIDSRSVRFSRG